MRKRCGDKPALKKVCFMSWRKNPGTPWL